VGIVFQSYALWPHMTVAENVGYPLRVARVEPQAHARRVAAALAMVGLEGFDARRPADLSGGERQCIAIARAMVADAPIMILDEPEKLMEKHFPGHILAGRNPRPGKGKMSPGQGVGLMPLSEVEQMQILYTLEMTENNKSKAARLLGISRDILRYSLQKYNLT